MNGSTFYYWGQIRDEDTNVLSESLDCGCPMMAGCMHPSEMNIDQMFHMTVVALDSEGVVYVPEFAWEVHWTVQVVEGGVWKEKYYGGYNSSFVFEYDRASESYSLWSWSNLWVYPEQCSGCTDSTTNDGHPLLYWDFEDDVVHEGEVAVSSYGLTNSSAYLTTAWYITDSSKTVLHAYSEPFCVSDFGSPSSEPTSVLLGGGEGGEGGGDVGMSVNGSSLCGACLADGEYIFRSTGACDADGSEVVWEFCGVSGSSQAEFRFWMDEGVCFPGEFGSACGAFSSHPSSVPSSGPSGEPSVSPSGEPSVQPSGQPSAQPSSQPSGRPSGGPSCVPSGQPSGVPSTQPSGQPSAQPSSVPTAGPSGQPSVQPSAPPSEQPSGQPTCQPSVQPSVTPSCQPSGQPSVQPSVDPSVQPSGQPSSTPSDQPTSQPSGQPTAQPSVQPTGQPSVEPSTAPSGSHNVTSQWENHPFAPVVNPVCHRLGSPRCSRQLSPVHSPAPNLAGFRAEARRVCRLDSQQVCRALIPVAGPVHNRAVRQRRDQVVNRVYSPQRNPANSRVGSLHASPQSNRV